MMLDDEKKKNVEGDNSNVEPNFILTVLQNKLLLLFFFLFFSFFFISTRLDRQIKNNNYDLIN